LPGQFTSVEFATGANSVPLAKLEGASGQLVTDVVSINGLAVNQSFLLCDEFASILDEMPCDGILGLGLPGSPFTNNPSDGNDQFLFWQLAHGGLIPEPVFSLLLNEGNTTLGELTLGGVDNTKFEGTIEYIHLNEIAQSEFGLWTIGTGAVYIDDAVAKNGSLPMTAGYGILDSGTSFIQSPDHATTKALYAQISPKITLIDPAGAWGAPCTLMETLKPNISFTVGDPNNGTVVNMTIPGSAFNLGEYPGQVGICQALFVEPVLAFGSNSVPTWILGSPMIKSYYTVWDAGNVQLGVASLKTTNGSSSNSGSGSGGSGGGGGGNSGGNGTKENAASSLVFPFIRSWMLSTAVTATIAFL
jgi:hypothetical protein